MLLLLLLVLLLLLFKISWGDNFDRMCSRKLFSLAKFRMGMFVSCWFKLFIGLDSFRWGGDAFESSTSVVLFNNSRQEIKIQEKKVVKMWTYFCMKPLDLHGLCYFQEFWKIFIFDVNLKREKWMWSVSKTSKRRSITCFKRTSLSFSPPHTSSNKSSFQIAIFLTCPLYIKSNNPAMWLLFTSAMNKMGWVDGCSKKIFWKYGLHTESTCEESNPC